MLIICFYESKKMIKLSKETSSMIISLPVIRIQMQRGAKVLQRSLIVL